MKIILEYYDLKSSIEISDESLVIGDLANYLFQIAMNAGFTRKQVGEAFIDRGCDATDSFKILNNEG